MRVTCGRENDLCVDGEAVGPGRRLKTRGEAVIAAGRVRRRSLWLPMTGRSGIWMMRAGVKQRALRSLPSALRPGVAEQLSGLSACEPPVDPDAFPRGLSRPGTGFLLQLFEFRDAPPAQTLP